MRSSASEQSTATKEAPLIRNTQPEPTEAISVPAIAGPIILAALNEVEFRATAFARSVSPTSSADKGVARGRIECRHAAEQEGEYIDMPQRDEAGDGEDAKPEGKHAHRGLGAEQELSPVEMVGRKSGQGRSSRCGPNCSAITTPIAVALLCVSCVSTSQPWAMRCIHVPILETSAPHAHTR